MNTRFAPLLSCITCGHSFFKGQKMCEHEGCPDYQERLAYTKQIPRVRDTRPNPKTEHTPDVVFKPKRAARPYKRKLYTPAEARLISVRQRSNKKKLDFDLTLEHIAKLLISPCVYCGERATSQLDRMTPDKGYTVANVVPACKRCNTVKSMYLSYDQMMIVAKALGWRK